MKTKSLLTLQQKRGKQTEDGAAQRGNIFHCVLLAAASSHFFCSCDIIPSYMREEASGVNDSRLKIADRKDVRDQSKRAAKFSMVSAHLDS